MSIENINEDKNSDLVGEYYLVSRPKVIISKTEEPGVYLVTHAGGDSERLREDYIRKFVLSNTGRDTLVKLKLKNR